MSEDKREQERAALAQAVRNLRENLPALFELETLQAQITRKKFLALVAEGFSEQQALELCRKVSS